MTAGTRLVTLPTGSGAGTRFNKTDSILVYANTDTDAIDIAKNYFPGNPNLDALWALATVTRPVAGADMGNWTVRVKVASPTGVIKADVTASIDPATYASEIFTLTAPPTALTAAHETFTLTGPPTAGDTVVIGGVTYHFVSPIGVTAGNVLFSTAADACSNLILAINAGANSGNYVATAISPNADVSAAAGAGTTVVLTAKTAGAAGNSITTTASITGQASAMPSAHLTGGTDADTVVINSVTYTFVSTLGAVAGNVLFTTAADACAHLIEAINGGANGGVHYVATSVSPNADVSAAAGVGTSVVLTAKTIGSTGNAITTTAAVAGQSSAMPTATLEGGADANTVDALGEDLVTLLNATADITHASYDTASHTLTAAAIADGLGDHTLTVQFYPPDGNRHPVASFVSTIVDVGVAAAVLTAVLVAANPIPSIPISALVNPFY